MTKEQMLARLPPLNPPPPSAPKHNYTQSWRKDASPPTGPAWHGAFSSRPQVPAFGGDSLTPRTAAPRSLPHTRNGNQYSPKTQRGGHGAPKSSRGGYVPPKSTRGGYVPSVPGNKGPPKTQTRGSGPVKVRQNPVPKKPWEKSAPVPKPAASPTGGLDHN